MQPDQLKCVGEFYMSYKLNEHSNGRDENCDNDFEEMDIIKFLTLGWFFYTQLINKTPDNTHCGQTGPVDNNHVSTTIE
jgi:hypothetical protein